MSKKRWLLVVFALILALVVGVLAYWDQLAIYLWPKSVLSKSLTGTLSQLDELYQRSPISMLADYIDPKGQYTAQMDLDTSNELLGPVNYNMNLAADTWDNRIEATGVVSTQRNDLDMSVYLDKSFMAISSEDLLGGAYYGIRYDTFPEDIRSIPLISMFVNQKILSEWENGVEDLKSTMTYSYRLPQMPEFSREDLQKALLAVLLLPGDTEKVQMSVAGTYVDGYRISYSAKGGQVGQLLRNLMDIGDGSDASVFASFYLYEQELVMLQLQGEAGGNSFRVAMELEVEKNTRRLRLERSENGIKKGIGIRHEAISAGSVLTEGWTVYPNFEMNEGGKGIRYRWEPVMGEMVLEFPEPVTLNLFETQAGLHIQTDRFDLLADGLLDNQADKDSAPISCNLTIQKGSDLITPAYKNIDTWSLDDLLVLLGGIGSLIGLNLQ